MAIPTDERQHGTKSQTDAPLKHGQHVTKSQTEALLKHGTKSKSDAPFKYSKEVQHSKNNEPGPSGQPNYHLLGPSVGLIDNKALRFLGTTDDYQHSDLSTKYQELQQNLLDHYPPGHHPADLKLTELRKQPLQHYPHIFRSHSPRHNHPRHHHPPPLHIPSQHPFQIPRPPPPHKPRPPPHHKPRPPPHHKPRPPPPNHDSPPSCPFQSIFSLGSPRHTSHHKSALSHSTDYDSPTSPHLHPNHQFSSSHPPNPQQEIKHHYPPHHNNPHTIVPFHFPESSHNPPDHRLHFQDPLLDSSTSSFPIPQSQSTLTSLPFINKTLPSSSLQSTILPSKFSPFSYSIPHFWKSSPSASTSSEPTI